MGVGHASWELKALIHTVCLFLLHAHCVVLWLWVLLSVGLIHSDLTDNLFTQILEHSIEEQLDVLARLGRLGLNVLCDLDALVLLCLSELVNLLDVSSLAGVYEAESGHLKHELTMLEEMLAEVVLQDEQVLIKVVVGLHLVLLLDDFLPHAHELPALELLEEGEVLDVVVRVTLDKPLAQRHEIDGLLLFVQGQTFARDRVVGVTFVLVGDWLQVVWVTLVVALQVGEDGLLLAASVKEQLNVLI